MLKVNISLQPSSWKRSLKILWIASVKLFMSRFSSYSKMERVQIK